MRNGVVVKDLVTPSGDHVIYLAGLITLPSTDKEIENFCQDIMAEIKLKSGMNI